MRAVVDAVVIGRNEGARLLACLASLQGQVRRVVYVDSGSTDGSVHPSPALPRQHSSTSPPTSWCTDPGKPIHRERGTRSGHRRHLT